MGASLFEFDAGNPEFGSSFNESTVESMVSKGSHVFRGLRSFVDVGGGTRAATQPRPSPMCFRPSSAAQEECDYGCWRHVPIHSLLMLFY
ncbi:hypothetical protein ACLOJK_012090 [Asimina triloba]